MRVKHIYKELDTSTPVLDELGISIGDTIRFRRNEEQHWETGVVRGDYKDGSITIIDSDKRWRAMMPDKCQILTFGIRGAKKWKTLEK